MRKRFDRCSSANGVVALGDGAVGSAHRENRCNDQREDHQESRKYPDAIALHPFAQAITATAAEGFHCVAILPGTQFIGHLFH